MFFFPRFSGPASAGASARAAQISGSLGTPLDCRPRVLVSVVFFRSESVNSAFIYLFKMILEIGIPSTNRSGVIFVFLLLIFDWSMRKNEKTPLNFSNVYIRRFSYIILGYAIIAHFQFIDLTQFLYFQF